MSIDEEVDKYVAKQRAEAIAKPYSEKYYNTKATAAKEFAEALKKQIACCNEVEEEKPETVEVTCITTAEITQIQEFPKEVLDRHSYVDEKSMKSSLKALLGCDDVNILKFQIYERSSNEQE